MSVKELTKKNYVILMDNEGNDILPVNDGNSVFVGDGSVKLNDKLTEVEAKVSGNESEIARVESEYKEADVVLDGKISAVEGRVGTLETDKADKTQVASDIASAKQELQGAIDGKADKVHTHEVSEINGLGTVATLNVGTAQGNVPVLGANGKLDESMIPAIAINEHFDATDKSDAMTKDVQNGDMVFVEGVTYICVDATKQTFEEKFRPLTSVNDAITKGEVEAKLATKVDKTEYALDKQGIEEELAKKALATEVGVVGELQTSAKVVVGAINEVKAVADGAKAKADENAGNLDAYKVEVEGKLADKADKADLTPINDAIAKKVETTDFDAYKQQVTTELAGKASSQHVHDEYALKTEVEAVESKVDDNTAAIANKVETSAFEAYKGEVTSALEGKAEKVHTHEEYALKAEMGAVSGLATSAKDTIVNAVNEVKAGVDANASAVATKVEGSVFEQYKTEAKGVTDGLDQRLAKAEGEIAGLAGAIKFRTFDVNAEDLSK